MELGKSFYAKLVAGVFALFVVAFLGFILFERAAYRFGIIGGAIIAVGILLLIVYYYDRKHIRAYDDEGDA